MKFLSRIFGGMTTTDKPTEAAGSVDPAMNGQSHLSEDVLSEGEVKTQAPDETGGPDQTPDPALLPTQPASNEAEGGKQQDEIKVPDGVKMSRPEPGVTTFRR